METYPTATPKYTILMSRIFLEIVFMFFWLGCFFIRFPFAQKNKKNKVVEDQKTTKEKGLLGLTLLGMMLLPLMYMFTPWLDFANYTLPGFLNLLGIALILPTLWLFYRSHKDLGRNWSASLELREEHTLITEGVYKNIRHPMYTAIWLWVILQALMLQNYIAGLSGIVSFGLLYFLRVNEEEKMMEQQFGKAYIAYKKKTKRLIPNVF